MFASDSSRLHSLELGRASSYRNDTQREAMSYNIVNISRREILKSMGVIIGATAVTALLIPKIAHMISKAWVQYQDHPEGDQYCASCVNFIPNIKSTANGTCMIVEGAISPHGWCKSFAQRLSSNGQRAMAPKLF